MGLEIRALDGKVGTVDELLFDDEFWTVRYLVVNTTGWLAGKKVLLSPLALGALDWAENALNVNLTCEQIENSPGGETDLPVSRQWEMQHYDYYSLPYYWDGVGSWGAYGSPLGLLSNTVSETYTLHQDAIREEREGAESRAHEHADAHLRSATEVTGYGIATRDGHLGHVEDILIQEDTWRICYLAVDTRDWWPGKKILLPPSLIEHISWPDRSVAVCVTRDQVKGAPEWEVGQKVTPIFEDLLQSYYRREK